MSNVLILANCKCFLYSPGWDFEKLNVTYDGHVLATLKREDVLKAHCLQIGALYIFNVNYEVDAEGKALKGNADYFNFVLRILWDMKVDTKQDRFMALWNEISP